jgi:His-Xaa-Ser repeat protein HxsA
MTKARKLAIPSFLAAGMVPFGATADVGQAETESGGGTLLDNIDALISSIEDSHHYTLAAHSSHASHASHGSHGSHRSSSMRPDAPSSDVAMATLEGAITRNVSSTPPTSILPSSPAIARKLKVLPGNSKKFHDIVMRAQIALHTRGYEVGAVDGSLHARTVAAIYLYQSDAGVVPSGKLTTATLSSLGLPAQ